MSQNNDIFPSVSIRSTDNKSQNADDCQYSQLIQNMSCLIIKHNATMRLRVKEEAKEKEEEKKIICLHISEFGDNERERKRS